MKKIGILIISLITILVLNTHIAHTHAATYKCSACATDYSSAVMVDQAATCTEKGMWFAYCPNCGAYYSGEIAPLGHNYVLQSSEATCTSGGKETYKCSRCGVLSEKVVDALGHDYEETITEATCTLDGLKEGVCKRCGDSFSEVIPALGHQGTPVIIEPTCLEDGSSTLTCLVCGEEVITVLEATGHTLPQEWTIVSEPTYFKEGLKTKECEVCGAIIEQSIDRLPPTVPIVTAGAGATIVALAIRHSLMAKKKFKLKFVKPELSSKSVLLCLPEGDYKEKAVECYKRKPFLEVSVTDTEELTDSIKENEPDLVILYAENYDKAIEIVENNEDGDFAIIFEEKIYQEHRQEIKALREEGKIKAFIPSTLEGNVGLVTLVLPLYKPDLHSDDTIEYIGSLADAFGIPFVSTITNLVVTGKDIKSNLDTEDKGVVEAAIIIEDIAGLLGLDMIESIAGLIDSADTIIAAFDSEAGAYETSQGISSASSVIETIRDLI